MRRDRRRGSAGGRGKRGSRSRLADERAPATRITSGPVGVAHGGLLFCAGWGGFGIRLRSSWCRAWRSPVLRGRAGWGVSSGPVGVAHGGLLFLAVTVIGEDEGRV